MTSRDITSEFVVSDARRFLSEEECAQLAKRVISFTRGGGYSVISISSTWTGELRWARNRPLIAGDRRNDVVSISRNVQGAGGAVQTNQTDDVSLRAAVSGAERLMKLRNTSPDYVIEPQTEHDYPKTAIWSEPTYHQTPETRGGIAWKLIEPAETEGLISAGYLSVSAQGNAFIDSTGRSFYAPRTFAQCSMTVRDPKGVGSGWAGASAYEWSKFDADKLTEVALRKCLASRNPVAIEPGRYTTILEPQATFTFADLIVRNRQSAEGSELDPYWSHAERISFSGGVATLGNSKLGARIIDDRITISHDPEDPDLGVIPFAIESGLYGPDVEPYRAVTWVKNGVLQNLSYDRMYALQRLGENTGVPDSGAFRMSGGTTSIDEMIETTKRGVLVTRFWNVRLLDRFSQLYTGTTRDGVWLIENGKIRKPVKNFRFVESPLFVLNNVDQLGEPVPVFSPAAPAIVPSMKVNDFNFSSLIDAV